MSISLPLSKGGLASTVEGATGVTNETLDIETCLRHFTLPEMLTDPVMCPNCDKKTQTKKQHVVSKLPKLLCLHLKRFDAASNKKIEEFVSFPCNGLNMGPFLPQWCEVSRAPVAPCRPAWPSTRCTARRPMGCCAARWARPARARCWAAPGSARGWAAPRPTTTEVDGTGPVDRCHCAALTSKCRPGRGI